MCSTSDPTIEFNHYKIDVKLLKFEMLQYYKIIYIKINFFLTAFRSGAKYIF